MFAWQRLSNAHAQNIKNNSFLFTLVLVKEYSVVTKSRKANGINHQVIRIMNEAGIMQITLKLIKVDNIT